jgi:hypothetical protein
MVEKAGCLSCKAEWREPAVSAEPMKMGKTTIAHELALQRLVLANFTHPE